MNTSDFCEYIWKLRENAGVSRPKMEKKWPWHRNTIMSYEKEARLPDVDYLYALSLETGAEFLELLKLRLSAGMLQLPEDAEFPGSINHSLKPVNDELLIEKIVEDGSMSPTITKGASIHIDSTDKELKQGKIYAFVLNEDVVPRRVQYGLDGEIILLSEDSAFININVPKEKLARLNVLGRVTSSTNNF